MEGNYSARRLHYCIMRNTRWTSLAKGKWLLSCDEAFPDVAHHVAIEKFRHIDGFGLGQDVMITHARTRNLAVSLQEYLIDLATRCKMRSVLLRSIFGNKLGGDTRFSRGQISAH